LKIYRNIEDFPKIEFPVVTIGTFDGVHVGHQQIIKRMIEVAKKNNGETVLVTFSPHPRLVIHADSQNLKFINTQDRKYQLMEQFGIDHLVEIPFTKEFSKTSSNDFIENIIVKGLGTRKLIIGYDHHFGKNRMGDYNKLFDLGLKYGFKVEKVNAQSVNNINVSSTKSTRRRENKGCQSIVGL
jgi:riboflavin kinase / FMN adenylyltransferase